MTTDKATVFANQVTALFRRHWAYGSVQRAGDQVTVQIRARNPAGLSHEDVEFAMTIEALRTMTAAPRENAERASE